MGNSTKRRPPGFVTIRDNEAICSGIFAANSTVDEPRAELDPHQIETLIGLALGNHSTKGYAYDVKLALFLPSNEVNECHNIFGHGARSRKSYL